MFSDNYLFFGRTYRVKSDSKEFLVEFRDTYRHFRFLKSKKIDGEIYLVSGKDGTGEPGIMLNGTFYGVSKPSARQIALSLPSVITSVVTSRYVFHGGVVSIPEHSRRAEKKGILICAYSAFGKTTLVLELLKRGFPMLSDELIPVIPSTKMVEPFPRAIHISGNTLNLYPELGHIFKRKKIKEKDLKEKILVDVEELPWGKLGRKCLPYLAIFLTPPGRIKNKNNFMELAVRFMKPGFLDDLKRLKGVNKVSEIGGRDFSLLRLSVDKGLKLMSAVKNLCDRWQIPVIYAHRGKAEPVNWKATPRLYSIPASQGILKFTQMLLLTSKSARLKQNLSGSSGRLLTQVAKLVKNVRFYEMIPGEINQMGETVERLVKKI